MIAFRARSQKKTKMARQLFDLNEPETEQVRELEPERATEIRRLVYFKYENAFDVRTLSWTVRADNF